MAVNESVCGGGEGTSLDGVGEEEYALGAVPAVA